MAPALLYHGTSIHNLLGILSDDCLRADLGDDGLHMGVSLTRSAGVARKFASEKEIETAETCFEPFRTPRLHPYDHLPEEDRSLITTEARRVPERVLDMARKGRLGWEAVAGFLKGGIDEAGFKRLTSSAGRADRPPAGAVLVLDAESLSESVGLSEVKWDGVSTEREVRSHGHIAPVMTHLVRIIAKDEDLLWYRKLTAKFPEEFSEPTLASLAWLEGTPLRGRRKAQAEEAERAVRRGP